MRRARRSFPALALLAALAVAGCGGSGSSPAKKPVEVAAAPSLQALLEAYGKTLKTIEPSFSFNGPASIALRIEHGLIPDVIVSTSPRVPEYLHSKGLAEQPVSFARNPIVLAVPVNSPLTSLESVAAKGIAIAIGGEESSVGVYAHEAIGKLPAAQARAIRANIRSTVAEDSDIVSKLTSGAADAGFLYETDVMATKGVLRAIQLPARADVSTPYSAAVLKAAKHAAQARAFIQGLISGSGRELLRHAGFLPPSA